MSENQNIIAPEIFKIQKMLFIYKALHDGWTVKIVEKNVFEFKKNKENQQFNLDNYLHNFVEKNLDISNMST